MLTLPRLIPAGAAMLLAAAVAVNAYALSTDKNKAIEVEADTAQLDDMNNVSVYRGNVVVTQGSIRMTGDIMTVHNTPDNKLDYLVMEGHPATYRELPDNSDVYDTAKADRMEYYELKNYVILTGNSVVTQKGLQFSGERIEYDTARNQVKAYGGPHPMPGNTALGTSSTGRVKVIIKKEERNDEPAKTKTKPKTGHKQPR